MGRFATSRRPKPCWRASATQSRNCWCAELHAPLQVEAVAEPAERRRLGLQRAGLAGTLARELVLAQAVGIAAERKQQVAAQVVQARQLELERRVGGQRLGLVERREAFGDAVAEAHARGAGDQRLSARSPGLADASRAARRRLDRFRRAAELEHQAAARHQQREADLVRRGEDEAALDQGQRRGVAELRRDRVARRQVCRRGARILGAVEVLGGEHEVARLEPLGGPAVEDASPLVQRAIRRRRRG